MIAEKFIIEPENSIIVVIDFQEKLAMAMKEEILDNTLKNVIKLINLAKIYSIPIVLTEQYPKGLGSTLQEIKTLIEEIPIEKIHFSCVQEEKFIQKLNQYGRKKIILTGMETHVCVWQTALDLIFRGFNIFVPKDGVCSRKKEDWKTGLALIQQAGGIITCTETLIFQILKKAGTPEFKKMLEFVK
ncbi:MAG: hydrolase [Thermodesulfovibrio sp.]|nr:hydrolase [Thermodesulfovibrio sp.]